MPFVDILTPTNLAIADFGQARDPKKLLFLPGGHFDAYVKGLSLSSGNAIVWYKHRSKGLPAFDNVSGQSAGKDPTLPSNVV